MRRGSSDSLHAPPVARCSRSCSSSARDGPESSNVGGESSRGSTQGRWTPIASEWTPARRHGSGTGIRARTAASTRRRQQMDAVHLSAELSGLQELLYAERPPPPARRAAGHRRRRQGRHDPSRLHGREPARASRSRSFKAPTRRGARARLPLAGPPARPAPGPDRDLQPLALRGRARRARARPRARRASGRSATSTSATSSRCSPTRARRSSSSSCTSRSDEQRKRLQARIDDPTKRWKFAPATSRSASTGTSTRTAYEATLDETSRRARPVVRRARQPQVVPQPRRGYGAHRHAEGMKLRYPEPIAGSTASSSNGMAAELAIPA